jgi:hypothetical protein
MEMEDAQRTLMGGLKERLQPRCTRQRGEMIRNTNCGRIDAPGPFAPISPSRVHACGGKLRDKVAEKQLLQGFAEVIRRDDCANRVRCTN